MGHCQFASIIIGILSDFLLTLLVSSYCVFFSSLYSVTWIGTVRRVFWKASTVLCRRTNLWLICLTPKCVSLASCLLFFSFSFHVSSRFAALNFVPWNRLERRPQGFVSYGRDSLTSQLWCGFPCDGQKAILTERSLEIFFPSCLGTWWDGREKEDFYDASQPKILKWNSDNSILINWNLMKWFLIWYSLRLTFSDAYFSRISHDLETFPLHRSVF